MHVVSMPALKEDELKVSRRVEEGDTSLLSA